MIDVASDLQLSVDFAADPFVLELGDGRRQTAQLRLEVHGVPADADLVVEVPEIPSCAGFSFAVDGGAGRIRQRRRVRHPSHPVEVTVPVACTGDGSHAGREGRSELTVRLRLVGPGGGGEPADFAVGLVVAAGRPLPFSQVLREELLELAGDEKWKAALRSDTLLDDPAKSESEKVAHLYAQIGRLEGGTAGLCFSGGGIRSATFNLGVLQGLAEAGLLERFHYLSSVSGGGYVSSWLAGWVHRARGLDRVTPSLRADGADPVTPETYPIRFLRRYSNYLTPRLGAFSADTWTVVAIVLRNLLLNWLVYLPILAAALALPLLAIAAGWPHAPRLLPALYAAGLFVGGVGVYFMSALRPSFDPGEKSERTEWDQRFLPWGLVPVLAAAGLLSWAAALWLSGFGEDGPGFLDALPWSALWTIVVPLVAVALAEPLRRSVERRAQRVPQKTLLRDLGAVTVTGAITACVYAGILAGWAKPLLDSPYHLYPLLAPALFLGLVLLGKSLFVAFASLADGRRVAAADGEAEREWWARWSAWTLISALTWLGAAAIAFFAPTLLDSAVDRIAAAAGAGGLGTLVSRLGKSAGGGRAKAVVLAVAAPLFCVVLLLLVAAASQALLAAVPPGAAAEAGTGAAAAAWWVPPFRGELWQVALAIAALAGAGLALGRFVDVNRFSLQAMYRNRLVRAYLGATNSRRRPNLFTGFDPGDDLPLHRLRGNRPWPLVNIALNLVGGADLAWQERKAESFTATPLHCGSARLGYRRSQLYGGENGLSLGTAVATSGAAASPSMGYHSSPAISFIMALFNARLGTWLGNPGPAGDATYTRVGPAQSARLLIAEALGQTDDREPYVYLSDGGHFENLGLYEMVRRRCRVVFVCDVGCDPSCRFDDLGNVLRKVRIDLGVPIEFEERIRIYPKPHDRPVEGAAYCAVGTIDYAAADGPQAQPGLLLYVKPTIVDGEPYDVTNYARSSKDFPHESTADQWFGESQFESYRVLGQSTIATILGAGPHRSPLASLRELEANVGAYLDTGRPTAPKPVRARPRKVS